MARAARAARAAAAAAMDAASLPRAFLTRRRTFSTAERRVDASCANDGACPQRRCFLQRVKFERNGVSRGGGGNGPKERRKAPPPAESRREKRAGRAGGRGQVVWGIDSLAL